MTIINEHDVGLVRSSVDAAVFLVKAWRDGELAIPAKSLYNLLTVVGEAGLAANDPLLEGIVEELRNCQDFRTQFGIYVLAIAQFGLLTPEMRQDAIARLSLPHRELSLSVFETPYGPDNLERLNLIEALLLNPAEHERATILLQIKRILAEPELRWHDRSYPLYLYSLVDPNQASNEVCECFTEVAGDLLKNGLWYSSLSHNAFVILNAVRSKSIIGGDLVIEILKGAFPRIRELAQERISSSGLTLDFKSLSSAGPETTAIQQWIDNFTVLAELVPYIRVVVSETVGITNALLSNGSFDAQSRVLSALHAERSQRDYKSRELLRGLERAVAKSLQLNADIKSLSGGLSDSSVYAASIDIERPFKIPGTRVVFKTDKHNILQEETSHWKTSIETLGLTDLFARVSIMVPFLLGSS